LCDALLDEEGRKAAGPEVKNGCAWLLLRAREPAVREPARALPLSREAWEESRRERPEIGHTYAVALADNGAAAEGLALLELLSVQGRGGVLGPGFLDRERARLGRLADEQARLRTGPPRSTPGGAADGPAGSAPADASDAGPDDGGGADGGADGSARDGGSLRTGSSDDGGPRSDTDMKRDAGPAGVRVDESPR
jgi:hypothetical protein